MMETHPERVIELAVKGMLPKNALGRNLGKKLKVYAGPSIRTRASGPSPWRSDGTRHGTRQQIQTVGRRKTAVARVLLRPARASGT
jgi:hypothetical protein